MVRQLVERIRNKDQKAMAQLYQMYIEELSSVCYRYVPAESDAKDVLQDSFIKIFTSLSTFDYKDESSFVGWMKRVVVNEAIHFLKERKKLSIVDEDVNQLHLSDEVPDIVHITADELHQMVCELPNGYRTIINLFVFEGYSHKEIATMLDIKEGTSASQFYHAKQLLAKAIKERINKKR